MIALDILRELAAESLALPAVNLGAPKRTTRTAESLACSRAEPGATPTQIGSHAARMKRTSTIPGRYRKRLLRRWGLDNPYMADHAWDLMFNLAMKEKQCTTRFQ